MNFESYYYIVWVAAFLTAVVSAIVGMLGGTLLLSVMAQFLKMEVLIPVHGLVQLTSNMSRAWFLREFIRKRIFFECVFGVLSGSIIGAIFRLKISEDHYNLFLGLFILIITFLPKFKLSVNIKAKWPVTGFVASSIGLYVGAVGVFLGSVFLTEKLSKKEMVSTQASCQSVLHFFKVLVFVYLGFVITPWLSLLAGTLAMTYLGTWVGTRILDKVSEKLFKRAFTLIIVILALRLIWLGVVFDQQ